MYQPLIKFHPHPAIFTQVLRIFDKSKILALAGKNIEANFIFLARLFVSLTIVILNLI